MQKYTENSVYPVTIVKIYSKGVLVLLDDTGQTDFIHISKISNDFIENIADFVSIGDEFEAIAVKRICQPKKETHYEKGEFELSLKHLNLKPKNQNTSTVSKETEQKTDITLDDMIESANQVLKEKLHAIEIKTKHSGYGRNRKQHARKSKNNRWE